MPTINFCPKILSKKEYATNDILLIMMKKILFAIPVLFFMFFIMAGCTVSKDGTSHSNQNGIVAAPTSGIIIGGSTKNAIPNAVIYRTSCDCSDLVPVNLNASGTALISYPAPSDITPSSSPVRLNNGWLLDRRGIGINTRFTNYTYAEYRSLSTAPSPAKLLDNLNTNCHITDIVRLPISASEAADSLELCNNYIASGLENCKIVYAESK